jgi:hypothetical protein
MRVEYTLIPKQEATVKDTEVSQYVYKIDQAEVTISVNENKIKKLIIAFCDIGYDISKWGEQTKIILREKELHYSAYSICAYISNRILTESNVDAFDCNEFIDNNAPEIYPENQQEKEDTARYKTVNSHIFRIVQSIENCTDLDKFGEGYQYEKAYTAYADGLRANSIFTRYVQTYKAIEAIVGDKEIDDKVSKITETQNPKLDKYRFGELRLLRNRCEHPHQSKGHMSSSDIQHIKELEKNLPDLIQIVKILFDHYKVKKETNVSE